MRGNPNWRQIGYVLIIISILLVCQRDQWIFNALIKVNWFVPLERTIFYSFPFSLSIHHLLIYHCIISLHILYICKGNQEQKDFKWNIKLKWISDLDFYHLILLIHRNCKQRTQFCKCSTFSSNFQLDFINL